MKKLFVAVGITAALAFASAASAAPTTTFGGATTNADGSVTLTSSATQSAGIDFSVPGGTFVGDLAAFSLDYSFAAGCPNGVPKLAIASPRGSISVSLGNRTGI